MIRTVDGFTRAMISLVVGAAGAGSGSDEKNPVTAATTAPVATRTATSASNVARLTDRSSRSRWITLESPETMRPGIAAVDVRLPIRAGRRGDGGVSASGSIRIVLSPIRSEPRGASITGRSIRRPSTKVPLLDPRSPTSTRPSTSCK